MKNTLLKSLLLGTLAFAAVSAGATCGLDPATGLTTTDSTCALTGVAVPTGSVNGLNPVVMGSLETLTYSVSNGTGSIACSLSGASFSGLSGSGTETFREPASGTDVCTLTVSGALNGQFVAAATTIIVNAAAPTALLASQYSAIVVGQQNQLSYQVANGSGAIACAVSGVTANSLSGAGSLVYTGSKTGAESCMLTVTGGSGTSPATSTAAFSVAAAPSGSLTAKLPVVYLSGGTNTNTLTYSVKNGNGSIACVLNGSSAPGPLSATGTVAYTATVPGVETCNLTVVGPSGVAAAPIAASFAVSMTLCPGSCAAPSRVAGTLYPVGANFVAACHNIPGYVAGMSDVTVDIVGTVYSNTAAPALTINGCSLGDTVTIIGGGKVLGARGAGGAGGALGVKGIIATTVVQPGGTGGTALSLYFPVRFATNSLMVAGGGGGGGGGQGATGGIHGNVPGGTGGAGAGGNGAAAAVGGVGGAGFNYGANPAGGKAGANGVNNAGGGAAGANGSPNAGAGGGGGGGLGEPGGKGGKTGTAAAAAGGAPGLAIAKNGNAVSGSAAAILGAVK